MEWGDITPLRTKILRLEEGDLFVSVVNKYGLQTDNATLYCCVVLRPTSMALATMLARMEAICQFHNWCGPRGIDFLQRLESGEFFQPFELAALREDLRRNLRPKPPASRKPKKRRRQEWKATVSGAHWRNRCVAIRDYVSWYAEQAIARVSVRDERLPEMRARLASFKETIVDGIRVRRSPMREGLTPEQEEIFLAAITPGDPSNPFEPRNQSRNQALWLTYYDGGLRLGEGLGLKTIDCHLNGSRKKLVVHRRPDDPEEKRRRAPLAKTLPHNVDIGERLVQTELSGSQAQPVCLPVRRRRSHHRCRGGGHVQAPERRAGDFSTNDARRAWNNRFAVGADKAGLDDETSRAVANHAQGRVPTSKQVDAYRGRYNAEKAAEIMLRMQDNLPRTEETGE
jgi:integrase